jgi:hypothetical protein
MGGGKKPLKNDKDDKSSTNTNSKTTNQQDAHKLVETRIEGGTLSDTLEPAAVALKGDMKPLDEVNRVEDARLSNSIANNGVDVKNMDSRENTTIKQFENSGRNDDATEKDIKNDGDMVEDVREKDASPAQAEAVFSSDPKPTNEKAKIEPNANTDLLLQTAANLLAKVEQSQLTATVFIAAPFAKNHYLAITGEDQNLGKWRQPYGKFEPILHINKDLYIFKGNVPIPSRVNSMFKFVDVNMTDRQIEYEGVGLPDNRSEELLPDSWNFFVFKPNKAKSMIGKVWEGFSKYMYKSEITESIAEEFFNIVLNHILENVLPGNKSCYIVNFFHNDHIY